MYYKSKTHLYDFLYSYLEFNEFEAILPEYFTSVYKQALNILLEKSLDYLKEKKVGKEQTEFFIITMSLECLYRVLVDFPLDKDIYPRLLLLLDDTVHNVEDTYSTFAAETPSFYKYLNEVFEFLECKRPPVC